MMTRLALVYGPELSMLSDPERAQLLIGLDVLTGFESWGRMREEHGLSIEAARELSINAMAHVVHRRTAQSPRFKALKCKGPGDRSQAVRVGARRSLHLWPDGPPDASHRKARFAQCVLIVVIPCSLRLEPRSGR